MGVAEAQQRISAREFAEWAAYYQLEPFGEARADLRAARVAWAAFNAQRDKPVDEEHFLLRFGDQPKRSDEEQGQINRAAMAAILGATRGDARDTVGHPERQR